MLEMIIDYLGTLGAGGLLIGVFIEALGLPFPGGIMVILAGVLASHGKIPLALAFGATVTGFTLGACTAFYLGKNVGEPVIERYGKYLHITPQTFEKAQIWIEQSSAAFILIGRFIPMVSNLTPYMAGISKLSWGRFLFYNSIFVFAWTTFNISLGLFFGHNWEHLTSMNQSKLPVAALGILIFYFTLKYKLARRRKAANMQ